MRQCMICCIRYCILPFFRPTIAVRKMIEAKQSILPYNFLTLALILILQTQLGAVPDHYTLVTKNGIRQNTALQTAPKVEEHDQSLYAQGYYDGDPLPPSTIYLSFDDGPGDFTAEILDILKSKEVVATFFLNSFVRNPARHSDPMANALLSHSDVLHRMVAEGHAIGNHTFSHRNLATQSVEIIDRELDLLAQHFREAYGPDAPTLHLIRVPFGAPWMGHWDDFDRRKVTEEVNKRGIVMMWGNMWDSGDSQEWVRGEWYTVASKLYHPNGLAYRKKIQRQLRRILRMADGKRSGVILMHDVHPTTRDMLPTLIDELKKRGYVFQTLEDYAKWRWGSHVFDRFHANDPSSIPPSPELPGITQAVLSTRPFPPNQATAPRPATLRAPNQATAPRIVWGKPHPPVVSLYDWYNAPRLAEFGEHAQAGFPIWFPRPMLPPPSDSLMAEPSEQIETIPEPYPAETTLGDGNLLISGSVK